MSWRYLRGKDWNHGSLAAHAETQQNPTNKQFLPELDEYNASANILSKPGLLSTLR